MKNLGDLHAAGSGLVRDLAKAAKYYQQSAEAGEPKGMVGYAQTLLLGLAGAKNEKDACQWYEKAAKSGEANAVNAVGACHENGFGRKRGLKGAMQWYQRSAQSGNSTAMRNLARLNDAGIGTPRDAPVAAAWPPLRSGAQATLNDLISTPGIWNKATYQVSRGS